MKIVPMDKTLSYEEGQAQLATLVIAIDDAHTILGEVCITAAKIYWNSGEQKDTRLMRELYNALSKANLKEHVQAIRSCFTRCCKVALKLDLTPDKDTGLHMAIAFTDKEIPFNREEFIAYIQSIRAEGFQNKFFKDQTDEKTAKFSHGEKSGKGKGDADADPRAAGSVVSVDAFADSAMQDAAKAGITAVAECKDPVLQKKAIAALQAIISGTLHVAPTLQDEVAQANLTKALDNLAVLDEYGALKSTKGSKYSGTKKVSVACSGLNTTVGEMMSGFDVAAELLAKVG